MSVAAFLNELRGRGVELELRDGRLLCRAPKGALTPELAAAVQDRKPAIVAFLEEALAEGAGAHPIPPIRPVARSEYMPVSYSQERLWYLSQVDQNPAVYNLPLSFRLAGPLRVDLLQRCLDTIEARHEALRTTVVDREGQAMQRIHAPRGLPLRRLDLRLGHRAADAPTLDAALQGEAMAPFDIAAGPLERASLIRTGDEEHYFLLVMHHIIADGLSTQIILRELVALYETLGKGSPSPLEALPVQFADYAVWQLGWLRGVTLERQLAYWKEQLGGELPTLDVAADFPRPPLRSANGSKEPLRLPKDLVAALSEIGREEGATTYMVLLALFNALLSRHSGQDDIIVGTPVANRTRQESANIVGFVANTLVLRTRLDGTPTFRELIRRVRDVCVGAFRHQDMPFQKLVEALNPPRDLSRTPIFQAFFTFHEISSQASHMGDLELHPVVAGSNVSRMDLSLFLRELDAAILGSLEYNTDIYSRETVIRMIGHLEALAVSAAASPDTRVCDLPMLTATERADLARWNATEMAFPGVLVHELVAAQALATPDRVAVRSGGNALTYRELEHRANRLAHVLQARGVGTDTLVGICLERSADMLVALLAVLKTGGAYVPLDPDFPPARLAYMLEDAAVRVVVCQRSTVRSLPPAGLTLLPLDDTALLADSRDGDPPCAGTPDSRAYVIYTSGSSGRPKGVEVRHRNVVNFLTAMGERPGITSRDVLVAVTTLSFDIAVLELFLPLTVGACVVIATRDDLADGGRLGRLLAQERATVTQAAPAVWRMVLDGGWEGPRLRALCGGEALPPDLARRLLPLVDELWNMYGPTETTVWSTCTRIADAAAPIAIGSPIGNTVLRIIDRFGQQVPVGVPGELLIGGAGVAKGYLGRPELTAERFTDDPTLQMREGIFYRTGDLARLRPDGLVEYLGRFDHQVKVQGFRIELGEIESVLVALPEVKEAVVSVYADTGGDSRLAAYVMFHAGRQLTSSEVRRALRVYLPVYMIPGLVVELDRIPRMPNGKIDRRALPNPLRSAVAERKYVPPVTALEQVVAETWRSLLQVERVGRHDNFFELGGHSLLSMRAVAMLEQRVGSRLDPRLMFFQTVEQIAAQLEPRLAAVGS